jgi:hypothetical protein
MNTPTVQRTLSLNSHGVPARHWAGRTEAAKVLREWAASLPGMIYLNQDDATDLAEQIIRVYLQEQPAMSFKSDVSFPERMLDDPDPMPSVGRSERGGDVSRRIRERDCHDLWAALRTFRRQYGQAALDQVIEDAAKDS